MVFVCAVLTFSLFSVSNLSLSDMLWNILSNSVSRTVNWSTLIDCRSSRGKFAFPKGYEMEIFNDKSERGKTFSKP